MSSDFTKTALRKQLRKESKYSVLNTAYRFFTHESTGDVTPDQRVEHWEDLKEKLVRLAKLSDSVSNEISALRIEHGGKFPEKEEQLKLKLLNSIGWRYRDDFYIPGEHLGLASPEVKVKSGASRENLANYSSLLVKTEKKGDLFYYSVFLGNINNSYLENPLRDYGSYGLFLTLDEVAEHVRKEYLALVFGPVYQTYELAKRQSWEKKKKTRNSRENFLAESTSLPVKEIRDNFKKLTNSGRLSQRVAEISLDGLQGASNTMLLEDFIVHVLSEEVGGRLALAKEHRDELKKAQNITDSEVSYLEDTGSDDDLLSYVDEEYESLNNPDNSSPGLEVETQNLDEVQDDLVVEDLDTVTQVDTPTVVEEHQFESIELKSGAIPFVENTSVSEPSHRVSDITLEPSFSPVSEHTTTQVLLDNKAVDLEESSLRVETLPLRPVDFIEESFINEVISQASVDFVIETGIVLDEESMTYMLKTSIPELFDQTRLPIVYSGSSSLEEAVDDILEGF